MYNQHKKITILPIPATLEYGAHHEPETLFSADSLLEMADDMVQTYTHEDLFTWRPRAITIMDKIVKVCKLHPGVITHGDDFVVLSELVFLIDDPKRDILSQWI